MKDVCYECGNMTREEVNEVLARLIRKGAKVCDCYESSTLQEELYKGTGYRANYSYFGVRRGYTCLGSYSWCTVSPSEIVGNSSSNTNQRLDLVLAELEKLTRIVEDLKCQ